jgi:ABC-type sulfate/molybdate transport systems ATPase subunit
VDHLPAPPFTQPGNVRQLVDQASGDQETACSQRRPVRHHVYGGPRPPVAALDPLARRHFLGTLADAVAAGGLTVVLSSHLVADIERVCDHLILLSASRVQLCGDIDAALAEHRVLIGPRKDTTAIERNHTVVQTERTARQTTMLVRLNGPVADPDWEAADVSLEDMVLAYMGAGAAPATAELTAVGGKR